MIMNMLQSLRTKGIVTTYIQTSFLKFHLIAYTFQVVPAMEKSCSTGALYRCWSLQVCTCKLVEMSQGNGHSCSFNLQALKM